MKKTCTFCQTGGKQLEGREKLINEDFAYTSEDGKIAILMDGATGLGGPKSINGLTSAEWYVKIVSDYLKIALLDYSEDLKTIIKNAVKVAKKEIKNYEMENGIKFKYFEEPSASLSIYREKEDNNGKKIIEIYEIGDSKVAVQYKDGRIEKLYNQNELNIGKLDSSVIKRMEEIAKESGRNVVDTRNDDEIQKMLKINREKKNTPNGYYILGTSEETVDKGIMYEYYKENIRQVLLFSDGFNYEIIGLTLNDIIENLNTEQSIEKIIKEIRDFEGKDIGCNRYPRLKASDDLSVILIGE